MCKTMINLTLLAMCVVMSHTCEGSQEKRNKQASYRNVEEISPKSALEAFLNEVNEIQLIPNKDGTIEIKEEEIFMKNSTRLFLEPNDQSAKDPLSQGYALKVIRFGDDLKSSSISKRKIIVAEENAKKAKAIDINGSNFIVSNKLGKKIISAYGAIQKLNNKHGTYSIAAISSSAIPKKYLESVKKINIFPRNVYISDESFADCKHLESINHFGLTNDFLANVQKIQLSENVTKINDPRKPLSSMLDSTVLVLEHNKNGNSNDFKKGFDLRIAQWSDEQKDFLISQKKIIVAPKSKTMKNGIIITKNGDIQASYDCGIAILKKFGVIKESASDVKKTSKRKKSDSNENKTRKDYELVQPATEISENETDEGMQRLLDMLYPVEKIQLIPNKHGVIEINTRNNSIAESRLDKTTLLLESEIYDNKKKSIAGGFILRIGRFTNDGNAFKTTTDFKIKVREKDDSTKDIRISKNGNVSVGYELGKNILREYGAVYKSKKNNKYVLAVTPAYTVPEDKSDLVKKVKLGEGVTHVMAYSFDGCKNLANIYLPESFRSLDYGSNAFGVPANMDHEIRIHTPTGSGVNGYDDKAFTNLYNYGALEVKFTKKRIKDTDI